MEPDVPLVIPEVNPDHLALVDLQRRNHDGFVVANGNCTAILLALTLKPLADRFGVQACYLVSMQALTGAGYPGIPALDIVDNVVPFIPEEEAKIAAEVPRFLGSLDGGRVRPATIEVSATCTRVPVLDGHKITVSARLVGPASMDQVAEAFCSFRGE